tara:strand:+ start:1837 stop:2193 length:357 start_codon:yes stop_codon:yes gene_type:complete
LDNPIGIDIDIINKTNKVMKEQKEVVHDLIDDIINHIKVMSGVITQLDSEINSDTYISNTEFIVKKNTIEILKSQSQKLSNILQLRLGEIMMIKGVPWHKVNQPINTSDSLDGDSKSD